MPLPLPNINHRIGSPIKLKGVLRQYRLSQAKLADFMTVAGVRMSTATINHLVNYAVFPKLTQPTTIIEVVNEYLTKHRVPAEVIATIWEQEHAGTEDVNVGKHPDAEDPFRLPPEFQLPEPAMLSEAARDHFNMFKHPFVDDVNEPKDVFLSKDQRYIRQSMYHTARHGGLQAIVGESGSGKTTLRRDLLDRIRRENTQVVVIQPQIIDKTRLTAAHICDAIISDISHERPRQSLEAKGRQIQRLLADSSKAGNSHVLIVEEAHDLAIPTLKYLKRFWELEDGFKKLLGIILIGQPELGERLDERRNYQAREVIRRIEIAELRSLNGNLEEYLELKFGRIGMKLDRVFAPDAYDAIRERLTLRRAGSNVTESQIYPLNVHTVVIRAMNQAAELGEKRVTAELIRGV